MSEEKKKYKNEFVVGMYASEPHEKVKNFIRAKGYIVVDKFYKAYAGQERVYFQIFRGKDGEWKMNCYIDDYETNKEKKSLEKLNSDDQEDSLAGIDYGENINPDDIPF